MLVFLILFGVVPGILVALVWHRTEFVSLLKSLLTLPIALISFYSIRHLAMGPPMFFWQPPYQISNYIFLLLPLAAFIICMFIFQPKRFEKKTVLPIQKYKNSSVSQSELDQLQVKLNDLIDSQRIYLQPDLTLYKLAVMLRSDSHTVSRLINERYGKNFFHFINAYRIEEFIQFSTQGKYKNLTFLGVAYAVGFKNKTSFINAFKREKNQTPREFFR